MHSRCGTCGRSRVRLPLVALSADRIDRRGRNSRAERLSASSSATWPAPIGPSVPRVRWLPLGVPSGGRTRLHVACWPFRPVSSFVRLCSVCCCACACSWLDPIRRNMLSLRDFKRTLPAPNPVPKTRSRRHDQQPSPPPLPSEAVARAVSPSAALNAVISNGACAPMQGHGTGDRQRHHAAVPAVQCSSATAQRHGPIAAIVRTALRCVSHGNTPTHASKAMGRQAIRPQRAPAYVRAWRDVCV